MTARTPAERRQQASALSPVPDADAADIAAFLDAIWAESGLARPTLDSYRRDCYDEALITAHQLNLPHFFWEHLYIALICGQLGRDQEAQTALARLLALRPDIATDADRIIEMVVLDPALVAHCIEGLRKAGLNTALRANLTR